MPEQNINLTVIIPAYKEGDNLAMLLPRLTNTVAKFEPSYEVLVVDTVKPMDRTEEVCKTNGAVYVPTEGTDSYGNAVRTGIAKASGKFVVFMDADGSHDPEFVQNLYAHKDEADVVIASRYTEGGGTHNTKMEIFMSRTLNIIYSVVLGLNCKDVSNSFKLYKAFELKALYLHCSNFDIIEEILVKLRRKNKKLKIVELPFTFKSRIHGQTKRKLIPFMITFAFTLIKLKFGK